jgi:hypothetical protein
MELYILLAEIFIAFGFLIVGYTIFKTIKDMVKNKQ